MKTQSKLIFPAVAGAVAFACGAADAATVSASRPYLRVSSEYVAAQASNASHTVSLPVISITPESNSYANDSTVKLTIAGASITSASALGTVTCRENTAGATVGMYLTYASVSSNVITFTVTRPAGAQDIAASAVVCSMPASSITVLTNTLSSPVTMNWTGVFASGTEFDKLVDSGSATGVGAVAIGNVASQYSSVTSLSRDVITPSLARGALDDYPSFSKTIDASNPTRWYSASTTGYTAADAFDSYVVISRDENAGAAGTNAASVGANTGNFNIAGVTGALTATKRVLTFTGDFSFADDDNNGCTTTDLSSGPGKVTLYVTGGATASNTTIDAACTTLSYDLTNTSMDVGARLLFTVEGASPSGASQAAGGVDSTTIRSRTGKALPTTAFSASTSFYNGSTLYKTVNHSSGAWTTSTAAGAAATAAIPYLPYGTGISRIVYLTNKSATQTLTVRVTGYRENGTVCSSSNFGTVTVGPKAVALLTTQIDSGLTACGVSSAVAEKAHVVISATSNTTTTSGGGSGTSSGFEITANYNVNGDRVNIINTTNK